MNYVKNFNTFENLIDYKSEHFVTPHVFYEKETEKIHYMNKYQILDHISSTSTGGQYIDLGYKLMENTDDIRIDMKFAVHNNGKNSNGQSVLLACKREASPYPGFVFRTRNGNVANSRLDFNAKWNFTNSTQITSSYFFPGYEGEGSGVPVKNENSKLVGQLIEDTYVLDNIPSTQLINVNATMFAGYQSDGVTPFRFIEADVYYVKIYKGGDLIRDMIPVKELPSGKIGLYDKVNNHLYESLGDQPFVGTELRNLPSSYTPLEYIASTSTGGQYIDLNLQMWTTSPSKYELSLVTNLIGNGASVDVIDSNTSHHATIFSCNKEVDPYPGFVIRAAESGSYSVVHQDRIPKTTYGQKNTILNIHQSGTYSDEIHNHSTYLFCGVNENNIPWRFAEARIYSCQISINDVLVRDLVPCKNDQDVLGLYDCVNDVFYTSQGSEQFIGPETNNS